MARIRENHKTVVILKVRVYDINCRIYVRFITEDIANET